MKKRKIYSECVNAKIARNQSGKRWQAVFVYALDAHGIKGYELKKHFFMPGGEVDKAHPFVSACVKKAGELLDRANPCLSALPASNASWWRQVRRR